MAKCQRCYRRPIYYTTTFKGDFQADLCTQCVNEVVRLSQVTEEYRNFLDHEGRKGFASRIECSDEQSKAMADKMAEAEISMHAKLVELCRPIMLGVFTKEVIEWVDVSQLPTVPGYYLVIQKIHHPDGRKWSTCDRGFYQNTQWETGEGYVGNVTHWAEIPRGPQ